MLSIIFIIEIIISLFESFTSFRWPISPFSSWYSYFGKELIELAYLDGSLIYSNFRPPTGFHWNTNNLAITMVMVLPFFICYKKLYVKLIGGISISLIIALTASRAVFIALLLIYFSYLFFIKKQVLTLSIIWLVLISFFWAMNSFKDSDNSRINEIANSIEALQLYIKGDIDVGGSLQWRRQLIDDGISELINTKGLGVGAGGSTALQEQVGGVAGRFTSMHNFWVEILVEGGLIVALIGAFWYVSLLYSLFKASKNNKNPKLMFYAQSLFLAMIGFLPAAIAASSTIYFLPMWIMFGLAISVISINREENLLIIK